MNLFIDEASWPIVSVEAFLKKIGNRCLAVDKISVLFGFFRLALRPEKCKNEL